MYKSIWEILGIEPTSDKKVIQEAFSKCSKEIHPEEDPESFRKLQNAYRMAMRSVSQKDYNCFENLDQHSETVVKEHEVEEKDYTYVVPFEGFKVTFNDNKERREYLIQQLENLILNDSKNDKAFSDFLKHNNLLNYKDDSELIQKMTELFLKYKNDYQYCRALLSEIQEIYNFTGNVYIKDNCKKILDAQGIQIEKKTKDISPTKMKRQTMIFIAMAAILFVMSKEWGYLGLILVFLIPTTAANLIKRNLNSKIIRIFEKFLHKDNSQKRKGKIIFVAYLTIVFLIIIVIALLYKFVPL